jgi:hypothetical protein
MPSSLPKEIETKSLVLGEIPRQSSIPFSNRGFFIIFPFSTPQQVNENAKTIAKKANDLVISLIVNPYY